MQVVRTILLASTWNPVLIFVITLLRGFTVPLDVESYLQLIPAMFGGWFLFFAVKKIYDLGRKTTGITVFIILAPITSLASLIGGLFGPIGIILYCLILSIPAWLIWLIVRWLEARKRRLGRVDDNTDRV